LLIASRFGASRERIKGYDNRPWTAELKDLVRQTIKKARRFAPLPKSKSGAKAPAAERSLPVAKNSYAAVAIRPGLIACDAVGRYRRRRMLEGDAPSLPVPGCDQDECRCRFVKYDDRRSGDDRRTPFGDTAIMRITGGKDKERRGTDRRARKMRHKPRAYFNDYDG
jgi:hypothetical protein